MEIKKISQMVAITQLIKDGKTSEEASAIIREIIAGEGAVKTGRGWIDWDARVQGLVLKSG